MKKKKMRAEVALSDLGVKTIMSVLVSYYLVRIVLIIGHVQQLAKKKSAFSETHLSQTRMLWRAAIVMSHSRNTRVENY